jgi:hypothetical protein
MKQQTAVEWLIDQLEKYELYSKISFQCLKEIEQAKEMEKEQKERLIDETLTAYGFINNLKTNKL